MKEDDTPHEPSSAKLAPLPTWERIAVGAIFGAPLYCGVACIVPGAIFHWIGLPVATVLWILLPSVAKASPGGLYVFAEAITGAIIGAVGAALVPLIFKRRG
jgi:hypothetical protein